MIGEEHSYFYKDSETGVLTSSSHPADTSDGRLRELSAPDFDRELRAKKAATQRLQADARDERDTKRAALAGKLGITVEELSLLG